MTSAYSPIVNLLLLGETVTIKIAPDAKLSTIRSGVAKARKSIEEELKAFELPADSEGKVLRVKTVNGHYAKFALVDKPKRFEILDEAPTDE